ncbi:MAG: hypothetical protein J7K98_01885 [Candidatus Aenigmarchaeota archaeon]|nr:hypothetical protein [Candidatus Aenigmarchaeota archaeon]
MLTLHDALPLGLCLTTQELLDVKKFLLNFCDGILLKSNDEVLKRKIANVKRELNAFKVQQKFLEGYKAVVLNNLDRIMNLVVSRFSGVDEREVENIINKAKQLMNKVLNAQSFEDLIGLDQEFKKDITLPVYELYLKAEKRRSK